MAALDAELMLPGHGPPVVGAGPRARRRSTDTADAARVAARADARADERGRPARRGHPLGARARATCSSGPTCGRCTTSPSSSCATSGGSTAAGTTATRPRLKPAPEAELAAELAALAGGAARLAERARESDDLRLAGHLAELAALAAPDDADVRAAAPRCSGAAPRLRPRRWPAACSAGPHARRASRSGPAGETANGSVRGPAGLVRAKPPRPPAAPSAAASAGGRRTRRCRRAGAAGAARSR